MAASVLQLGPGETVRVRMQAAPLAGDAGSFAPAQVDSTAPAQVWTWRRPKKQTWLTIPAGLVSPGLVFAGAATRAGRA